MSQMWNSTGIPLISDGFDGLGANAEHRVCHEVQPKSADRVIPAPGTPAHGASGRADTRASTVPGRSGSRRSGPLPGTARRACSRAAASVYVIVGMSGPPMKRMTTSETDMSCSSRSKPWTASACRRRPVPVNESRSRLPTSSAPTKQIGDLREEGVRGEHAVD